VPRPSITVSTFGIPFAAFSSVSGSANTLPPAIGSVSGAIFHAKMSPAAIAPTAGKTMNASPDGADDVWRRGAILEGRP
jgi:hypothetical protein